MNRCVKGRSGPNGKHSLKSATRLAALTLAVMLSACDAQSPAGSINNNSIELGIPTKIRNVAAVNLDAVTAIANVTINNEGGGQDYSMARVGDRFQTTISLENATSVSVNLRFSEQLDSGDVINLARHSQITREVGSGNIVMEFFEGGFDDNFDDDNDGITNLQERNLGTDPLTPSQVRQNRQLSVEFTLPANLPDPLVTQSIVTFDGVPRAVSRVGNNLTITGSITTLNDVDIEVVLLQRVNNRQVVLATATRTIPAGFDDLSQPLTDGDFDFSRDDDGDGQTNLEEVRNGTDPFTAN